MRRVWITKDGQHLKIKDMKTSHIENCIKMLHRQYKNRLAQEYGLLNFVTGEQAELTLENSIAEMEMDGIDGLALEYIQAFEKELERRTKAIARSS